MLKILVLGSGGSVPTAERACSSILIGPNTLVDCGCGALRNMLRAGVDPLDIERILITHMHADHVSDLVPLLWSMGLGGRSDKLTIYGPPGIESGVKTLIRAMNTSESLIPYRIGFVELKPGQSLDGVVAVQADHTIPALCYSVVEGDVKVCVSGDTRPSKGLAEAFRGADVLFYESTFSRGHEELAMLTGHSTSAQAGDVARMAGVRVLILYHLHGGRDEILRREASSVFYGRVEVARDLMVLEV